MFHRGGSDGIGGDFLGRFPEPVRLVSCPSIPGIYPIALPTRALPDSSLLPCSRASGCVSTPAAVRVCDQSSHLFPVQPPNIPSHRVLTHPLVARLPSRRAPLRTASSPSLFHSHSPDSPAQIAESAGHKALDGGHYSGGTILTFRTLHIYLETCERKGQV